MTNQTYNIKLQLGNQKGTECSMKCFTILL